MKTIYKYPLGINQNPCSIMLPACARVLHAGYDPLGALCIWALVDTDNPPVEHKFLVSGTGWDMELPTKDLKHINTVNDGGFIWHVFEII